jgi:hypothetical protein
VIIPGLHEPGEVDSELHVRSSHSLDGAEEVKRANFPYNNESANSNYCKKLDFLKELARYEY